MLLGDGCARIMTKESVLGDVVTSCSRLIEFMSDGGARWVDYKNASQGLKCSDGNTTEQKLISGELMLAAEMSRFMIE